MTKKTRAGKKAECTEKPDNPYIPINSKVEKVFRETKDTKTLRVSYPSNHAPGQFVQVSVLGKGEAPISICSHSPDHLELCVRDVGEVTHALQDVKEKDVIGIRGPYGSGYPMDEFAGKKLLIVGGGSGVAPLRGIIKYIEQNAGNYEDVTIMLGFRNPDELLFRRDLDKWDDMFNLKLTCDKKLPGWKGNVGLITELLEKSKPSPENTVAFLCGPPIMIKFVLKSLKNLGFEDRQIWLSLERRMKCGVGKCGHCTISSKYVCKDGPVFNYTEAKKLTD